MSASPLPEGAPRAGVIHVRHRHPDRFVVIGNHLSQHLELSALAIGLAVHILSLPDGDPVTVKGLANRFPEGEITVRRAMNELVATGYLERRRVPLGGGRFATRTFAYDHPSHRAQDAAQPPAPDPEPPSEPPPPPPPPPPPAGAVPPKPLPTGTVTPKPAPTGTATPKPPQAEATRPATAPQKCPAAGPVAPESPVTGATQPAPATPKSPPTGAARPGTVRLPHSAPEAEHPAPAASGPASGPAADLLARLRLADPRLLLSARDIGRLVPAVDLWLARAATPAQIVRVLTTGLPPDPVLIHHPARLLAYRLTAHLPPPLPADTPPPDRPAPLITCDGCDRAIRSHDPTTLCTDCRPTPTHPPREHQAA
ncbi:hypothetical protein [Streptomyces sp. NBC_01190]|uniref:hypothetical protein n=1 Tax=Streptomyces sp. NBC_01190 TaxID=2903767 RepID=UPI003867D335|nr:hypothetical protein OG519_21870 [Streptomyces sp. NBC_01190]